MALAPELERFIGNRVARREVVEAIASFDHAFPMDELYRRLRSRSSGFSRATMYRTVRLLLEIGLLRESALKGGTRIYQLSSDGLDVHWVCDDCSAIRSCSSSAITAPLTEIADSLWLSPTQLTTEIHFRCKIFRSGRPCPNKHST